MNEGYRVVRRKRPSAAMRAKRKRQYRKRKSSLKRYARKYRRKSSVRRRLKRLKTFRARRHLRKGQRISSGLELSGNLIEIALHAKNEESLVDQNIKQLKESINSFAISISQKPNKHYEEAFKAASRTAKKLHECYDKIGKQVNETKEVEFNEWDLDQLPAPRDNHKKYEQISEDFSDILGFKKPKVDPQTQQVNKIIEDLKEFESQSSKLADLSRRGELDEKDAKDFLSKAHKYLSEAMETISEKEDKDAADPAVVPNDQGSVSDFVADTDADIETVKPALDLWIADHSEGKLPIHLHVQDEKQQGKIVSYMKQKGFKKEDVIFEMDEKTLSSHDKNNLPDSAFAVPKERKYPIHDIEHARNALARVSQFGSSHEKELVKHAVHAKFPELKEIKEDAQSGEVFIKDNNAYVKNQKTGGYYLLKDQNKGKPLAGAMVDFSVGSDGSADVSEQKTTGLLPTDPQVGHQYEGSMDEAKLHADMIKKSVDAMGEDIATDSGLTDEQKQIMTSNLDIILKVVADHEELDAKDEHSYLNAAVIKSCLKQIIDLGESVKSESIEDLKAKAQDVEESVKEHEKAMKAMDKDIDKSEQPVETPEGPAEEPTTETIEGAMIEDEKGGKGKIVSHIKQLEADLHKAMHEQGIEAPGGQDVPFKITGHDEADTVKEKSGKTFDYPEMVHFNVDSWDTIKASMTADGRIIREGHSLNGKGESKESFLKEIIKNVKDWSLHAAEKKAEKEKNKKSKDESINEDHQDLKSAYNDYAEALKIMRSKDQGYDEAPARKAAKKYNDVLKSLGGPEKHPGHDYLSMGKDATVERHGKGLKENHPEWDTEVHNLVKDAFAKVVSEYDLYGGTDGDAEEIEHESRDGFISSNDGGYRASGFTDVSHLVGSGQQGSLPDKAEKAVEKSYEENLKYALDDFKEKYAKEIEGIPEDKLNYHDLIELKKNDLAEKLSEMENDHGSDENSTVMFELICMFNNEDDGGTFTIQGVVNWEAPYHRNKGAFEDFYQAEVEVEKGDDLEKKLKAEIEKAVKHMGA